VVTPALPAGSAALGDFASADAVWALPVNGGSVDAFSFRERVELPLADDGTFTYTPSTMGSYDTVFALVNSDSCTTQAPRGEWTETELDQRLGCIQGYVTIPDGEEESLLRIPTGQLNDGVELGDVSPDMVNESRSTRSLEEVSTSFDVSIETLRAMAQSDDVLKSFAYRYANIDDSFEKSYNMHALFNWRASLTSVTGTANPEELQTDGYGIMFDTNVDVDGVTAPGTGLFFLYPPAAVESGDGGSYDADTPFEATHGIDGAGRLSSASGFVGVSPPGEWKLRRGNADGPVVAKYDMSLGAPFRSDSSGSRNPRIFLPSVFVNTDSDNKITSIDLSFYVHDGTSYAEVPRSVVQGMTGSLSVGIGLTEGLGCAQSGESIFTEILTSNAWTPEGTYALTSPDQDPCAVSHIDVGYFMMDTLHQFSWHDGSL
jgi:hypothetical protein